jgi:phosphoribosylformylglycinamidine synthase
VPIPGTLLISALAIVPSLEHVTTIDVKEPGSRLYLVGLTRDELGGSHLLMLDGLLGTGVPRVDLFQARMIFRSLHAAIMAGLVRACHDLSEGGLGVAAAEMLFAGTYGIELDLRRVPYAGATRDAGVLLWSESPTRFLVEVAGKDAETFERQLQGLPFAHVGEVLHTPTLHILGVEGEILVSETSMSLQEAWQSAAHNFDATQEQLV